MTITRKKVQPKDSEAYLLKIAGKPLRIVAVNDRGSRIGQDHHRATLTDHEVELMRRLHEEFEVGHPQHVGYRRLATMFDCTKTAARKICNYLIRAQTTAGFKRVT